jgi:hypothetical protein
VDGGHPFRPRLEENWEDYVDVTRRCALICEDADLCYALEPHPYRHMSNTASMLRLIEHVGSHALGMNFDPSHLFPVRGTPHVVIYQLAERILPLPLLGQRRDNKRPLETRTRQNRLGGGVGSPEGYGLRWGNLDRT